uniref:Uncharacterized protein n=1 Tax=Tanacetum cinerariifolium TaxID=118510 RepID=A0A6L2L1W5_TANCI|nr:hypothetical protein [Tanacetum cinerariifolium]
MNDKLFTYEARILVLSNIPCVEQQVDDSYNGNLDVYERKLCYGECEKIYVKAIIFINKRLVRLIDVTVEEWLELKYGDRSKINSKVKENVIATWGDDKKLSNLDEEYLNDNEVAEIFRIETDVFHFESPLCGAFKLNEEKKNAWIYEWNKDVPWVANMSWLDYGPWMEPSEDIEHVANRFAFRIDMQNGPLAIGKRKIFQWSRFTRSDSEWRRDLLREL